MANNVLRLTPEDHQRYRDMVEASNLREAQAERDREAAFKLAVEEERRAIAVEEERRAAELERLAARTAALVVGALARSRIEPEPLPQLAKPVEQPTGSEPGDDQVFTVDEFCARNKISRSNLYERWKRGVGPERVPHGPPVRITRLAERLWQRQSGG